VTAFQILKRELPRLGYAGDLLQEDYVFDDASAAEKKELCIPLGAFAQWPPSYRTACIGVVQANGKSGTGFVSSYRAFGAPMFLEVHEKHVVRYRMEAVGQAVELESIPSRNLSNAFEANKDKWNPEAIFRAKAISPVAGQTQLDFFDAGLLPALKGMIHKKLDRLLKETLHTAISTYRQSTSGSNPEDTTLFRLVFRFLAAKIFKDKKHPGQWSSTDPRVVINAVQKFYGLEGRSRGRVIDDPYTQQVTWDRLRTAFNFQNLSEEDLAFIYENTLVSEEARRQHGIHATPPPVAELIVDHLPFEDLQQDERIVLEPFAGHGVFLVAAMRRLRDLLPSAWSPEERHVYLKERLRAIERDPFAREVCRLSLTLADYPNPNGWQITSSDIFDTDDLEKALPTSRIVLCNPPFEDFSDKERKQYAARIQSPHKPYEILRRVLEDPPSMLGFVLPKSAIIGGRYDTLQRRIAAHYTHIETVALPDRVFAFSDQETMLLIASRPDPGQDAKVFTKTSWVLDKDRNAFLAKGNVPEAVGRTISRKALHKAHKDLWNPPFWELWEHLKYHAHLDEVADIHRGIEWNIPFEKNKDLLISAKPRSNFSLGIDKVQGKLEPYWLRGSVYLNMEAKYQRTNAHDLPWDKEKVLVSRRRVSRGPWRIAGYPDSKCLVARENIIAIWPKSGGDIFYLAGLINAPLTNVFLYLKGYGRDNAIEALKEIPYPNQPEINKISSLVRQYMSCRARMDANSSNHDVVARQCVRILLEIDGLILKSYDLPPRIERKLLDFFRGHRRPVPFSFTEYFPPDFKPCIPLHQFLAMDIKESSAGELLKRIEPLDSEVIHNFVMDLEERQV